MLEKLATAASTAQGRLDYGPPVAVIDIGSNSVRLVVYEGVTRSPTPLFNEKTLAGLGREVQTKGLLVPDAVAKAFDALKRFRALCDTMRVERLWVLATAACRDARNGREFIAEAEKICRTKIDVISGQREAELTALGVVAGFHRPDGIVGDLGGGSLELVDVHGSRLKTGTTLPLGGLALQDRSGRSIKKAEKLVEGALKKLPLLKGGEGRSFYAIGGTWRSLAHLHMAQTGYPLHVMHGYVIRAREALEFSRLVRRVHPGHAVADRGGQLRAPAVSGLRGAGAGAHHPRRRSRAMRVFSALGVREGLLYSLLGAEERKADALLAAARVLNRLRSRSPQHGEELIAWTDAFMATSGIDILAARILRQRCQIHHVFAGIDHALQHAIGAAVGDAIIPADILRSRDRDTRHARLGRGCGRGMHGGEERARQKRSGKRDDRADAFLGHGGTPSERDGTGPY